MTKEGLKRILPIIQAFIEGKTIQRYDDKKNDWYDVSLNANIDFCYEYRIKPEQTYRPFNTLEECWNEMLKHQPFGWIKDKYSKDITHISLLSTNTVTISSGDCRFGYLFDYFEFIDGTPFGIKEE